MVGGMAAVSPCEVCLLHLAACCGAQELELLPVHTQAQFSLTAPWNTLKLAGRAWFTFDVWVYRS